MRWKNGFLLSIKEHWCALLIWTIISLVSQNIYLQFPVNNDSGAAFNLLTSVLPMTLYLFPLPIGGIFEVFMWLLAHVSDPFPLTLGLPTLFASLSWYRSENPKSILDTLLHLVLPALCIALFCLSPVGSHAKCYSLFWLVPIALYFLPVKGIALTTSRAIKSSFIAHAVGSVFWVYLVPMTHADWNALIPIVALERCVMSVLGAVIALTMEKIFHSLTSGRKENTSY